MTRFTMWILAGSLATGCVSKGKYNELETMYDKAVAERDQATAERDAATEKADKLKERMKARTESFMSVYDTLLQIREKKLAKVKIEDGRAVLQLQSDVLFASGSADLTKEGKAALQEIAKMLGAGDGTFQVEGHTDSDAIKSKVYPTNWHLGSARAINVTAAMIEAGMPASRISAASFGDTKPVEANDTAEHKADNRRIELVWVPELSELLNFKKMVSEMRKDAKSDK